MHVHRARITLGIAAESVWACIYWQLLLFHREASACCMQLMLTLAPRELHWRSTILGMTHASPRILARLIVFLEFSDGRSCTVNRFQ